MTLKLISFELADSSRSFQLSNLLSELGACVRLTETTFVVDTSMTTAVVLKKLMKAVDLDDDVYVLEVSDFWSAYGKVDVHRFLEAHTRRQTSSADLLSL